MLRNLILFSKMVHLNGYLTLLILLGSFSSGFAKDPLCEGMRRDFVFLNYSNPSGITYKVSLVVCV